MRRIIFNIKQNYSHVRYTLKHYIAFMKLQKRILGYYKYKLHDLDKIIIYLFLPFLEKRLINRIHQKYQKHHPVYYTKENKKQYKSPNTVNWEEAIIDWECARETKPDKPLNAYNTLLRFYPEYVSWVEPLLRKFNLWEK